MRLKFRLLALMLVFVLLMPMIVACSDPAVENTPAADKTPVAGELAELPEETAKVDPKDVLIETLRNAEIDANKATITAKFKGDITVSFLDPDTTYSTSDIVDYVDDEGYITIPTNMIESMLMGDSVIAKDFVAIYKQMLVDTFTQGDFADLESMLEGLVESFDIESFVAKYTAPEYVSAYAAIAAIGSVLIANEYIVHMEAGEIETFEYCATDIAEAVENLFELAISNLEGESDLAEILYTLYDEDLLGYLYRGSECGINNDWSDTFSYLDSILGQLAYGMYDYADVAAGVDSYALEVYYPAFADVSYDILNLLTGKYTYANYVFVDMEYVVDALNEYLGSEDGPFANFDLANVMVAYGCAALAIIYSNEMIYDYAINYTEYEVAYFNLGTETWWMNTEDGAVQIATDDVYIIGDVYDEYKYAVNDGGYISGGYSYYSASVYAGADYVYKAYRVSIGAEHVALEDTAAAAFNEMFGLFVSGIGGEMDETDSVMAVAAITAYVISYVGVGNEAEGVIPQSFGEKMILSLLNGTVIEGAEEAIANVAALIGIKDEDDTDDNDPVQDFIDEWINVVEMVEGDFNAEQTVLALVFEALADLYEEIDEYYAANAFSENLALFIAAKYLGYDFIYEGEDLTDGIPAIVAAVMLEEFARRDGNYVERGEIIVFLNEYYEGDMEQIVNYEDILAMALLIKTGSIGALVSFEYPFDAIEYACMNMAFQRYAYNKFCAPYVDDADYDMYYEQYEQAYRTLSMLATEIYIKDAEIPAATAVSAALWVFVSDNITPENSEFFQILAEIANEAIVNDGFDPNEYPIENVIGAYIVPALFVDLGDGTRLIDVICAEFVAAPDGAVAMGDIIEAVYLDSLNGFEAVNGFDAEFYATLLTNVSIALDANGYPTDAIDNILAALALVDGDLDLEVFLNVALPELCGDEAYAALTDVIIALSADIVDVETAVEAIDDAIDALAEIDDIIAVGYLRAVKGLLLASEEINGAASELDPELTEDEINAIMQQALIDALASQAPTSEGIANYVALMYFVNTYGINLIPYAPSVLYMTEDEFCVMFDSDEFADVIAVRAWALKYVELCKAEADIDAIELAVEYLLAAGYYDEEEIPAESDPDFYEKLAVIYTANEIFCFDGYADVVVDIVFNPENIYLHGDALLELAESIIPETQALFVVKSAFYLLSTVAYLGVEDASTVDWDAALAYIPEYYAMFTGEELEIANNEALADMLRATFAEKVNTAITTTVVPYQTPTETLYVVTIVGDLDHSAINGSFEIVIEIRIANEDIVLS